MIKKVVAAVVVLAAGIAVAMHLSGGSGSTAAEAFTARTDASESERISDLEKALAAQVERGNQLDTRLGELEGRLGKRNGDADTSLDPRAERGQFRQRFTDAEGNFDPAAARQGMRERQLDRLVQAGFTRERAEWIERRSQELQLQAQQAQYDAQRNGQPFRGGDVQSALRKEIGDAEYEKYLAGTGRQTNVPVMEVLASSAAEKSGLKAGDQIVSYAGTRVFEMSELNALTRQGSPGESVTVEVQRDGQVVQVQVPRGVLGVQGGGGRDGGGPGGFRGGPPGGF
jgi:hypothetical protein